MKAEQIIALGLTVLLHLSAAAREDHNMSPAAQEKYTIHPVPHQQELTGGTVSFSRTVTVVAGPEIDAATLQRAADVLTERGLGTLIASKPDKAGSNLILGVNNSGDAADKLASRLRLDRTVFGKDKFDRHVLSMYPGKGGKAQVLILGENTDAVFCGLASLEQMLDGGSDDMCCANLYDYADIKDRGIIEGYYGVPYSAEVTKDLFRFMARYKMNTYMYGAKSDPYHSRCWSEPYPGTITPDQERIGYLSESMLKDIAEVAGQCKVNFIWAIHPGASFTDEKDTTVNGRIMSKFQDMYDLGVRQFGVFVDDVGVPSDKETLDIGAARLTRLQEMIDAEWDDVRPLHYVPQLYAYSWVPGEQARRFFESLRPVPPKVNIYITGRAVWTVPNNGDVDLVENYLGKPVSWWWNYPCNDNDMTKLFPMDIYSNFKDESHIDNLARLESLSGIKALIINPMQQGEVSKITLFSVADYAWNNAGFDNQRSFDAAIPAVVGQEKSDALRTLAPYLRYYDADALKYDVAQYKQSVKEGHPRPGTLAAKMRAIQDACSSLKALEGSSRGSDRLLYRDLRPWLLKLEAMASETGRLLAGDDSRAIDYEGDRNFQFEILNGMGEDISLSVRTAEPAAEVLYPFILYLRENVRSTRAQRMEWFSHAKLGIFIHWGIYSRGDWSESWCVFNKYVDKDDYYAQAGDFTASNYHPEEWVRLIKESGAKYTVLTTKHHDGFALWDTKVGKLSSVKSSAAGRDVLTPFTDAVRKAGDLRLGLYFSLLEWPHEDYPCKFRDEPVTYYIHGDTLRWQRFLDYTDAQLKELNDRYHPDLIWFDGDWDFSSDEWKAPHIVAKLRETNPDVVINSRIRGNGDYATPEHCVPVVKPHDKWWESCITIGDSWGYRKVDTVFKSEMTVLRMLVNCMSMGGNLLLDIGPRADGTIPEEEVRTLKALGRWIRKHEEAVYPTRAGIPEGHVQAYTTLNKAGDILYVYLSYAPNEAIEVKGLKTHIRKVRVVGSDKELDWMLHNEISWSEVPGVYYINVPKDVLDPQMTVLALELEGPLKLYRGSGQVISYNE